MFGMSHDRGTQHWLQPYDVRVPDASKTSSANGYVDVAATTSSVTSAPHHGKNVIVIFGLKTFSSSARSEEVLLLSMLTSVAIQIGHPTLPETSVTIAETSCSGFSIVVQIACFTTVEDADTTEVSDGLEWKVEVLVIALC